jgi:sarcosine/dimethylglycine N-methyltransferase
MIRSGDEMMAHGTQKKELTFRKDTIPIMTPRHEEKKEEVFDEQTLWASLDPAAWHNSISGDSVFADTYKFTAIQIEAALKEGGYDAVIEAGCGTGEIIGTLKTDVPCFGVDLNERFIAHCKQEHDKPNLSFIVLDILNLQEWWDKETGGKYKKPLVICVNNTLNIMPEELRGRVVEQMLSVIGGEGRCLVTYWNGNFFSHAIMNYYMRNQDLCGKFDMNDVDWKDRFLETPSGYKTHWMLPVEVQRLLRSCDVNIDTVESAYGKDVIDGKDHINCCGIAIFAWFSVASTSYSKSYYDSDDAQAFYSNVWGNETVHIGRYDLLSKDDHATLTKAQQLSKAEDLHEAEFIKRVNSKFQGIHEITKIRILDMGCGYGGLLRRLWEKGHVWSAVGCDISSKMCDQARMINTQICADKDIEIMEESYLSVSVPDESQDLVISMDALLHIGPDGQKTAIKEAARALRPGGWMIFSDIMQQEEVDPVEMQPLYDRIHLSKLGTVGNYKEALAENGFTNFEFEAHSENVASHYGTVRQVLLEKKGKIPVSEVFLNRMETGLSAWEKLGPKNIVWGFVMAQKTEKIDL